MFTPHSSENSDCSPTCGEMYQVGCFRCPAFVISHLEPQEGKPMQWIADTWDSWVATIFWLTTMMIVLGFFAWPMPCNRGMYWWTNLRAAATDLCYWFVTPVFMRLSRTVLMAAGIALLFGGGQPGFAFIEEMPIWQQLIA